MRVNLHKPIGFVCDVLIIALPLKLELLAEKNTFKSATAVELLPLLML